MMTVQKEQPQKSKRTFTNMIGRRPRKTVVSTMPWWWMKPSSTIIVVAQSSVCNGEAIDTGSLGKLYSVLGVPLFAVIFVYRGSAHYLLGPKTV